VWRFAHERSTHTQVQTVCFINIDLILTEPSLQGPKLPGLNLTGLGSWGSAHPSSWPIQVDVGENVI